MKKSDYFRICRNAMIHDILRTVNSCCDTDCDPAYEEDVINLIYAIHEADTEIRFYGNNPDLDTEV